MSGASDHNKQPYGSAMDLPSVARMATQIAALKRITRVVARDQRSQLEQLELQLIDMVAVIDGFYAVLGPRDWVFHERMDLDAMRALSVQDTDIAEAQLVAYYQQPETLGTFVQQLMRFPELQVRRHLLELAIADYEAGRYYAVVLVLLSVLDGFVNDLDPQQRRGLHARDPDDLHAWDSVVGHHQGLGAAHRSFTKATYKTDDKVVLDLNRNGIVHGTLINYNNPIVATKAWNRLFAVADWADTTRKEPATRDAPPRWRDLFRQLVANAANRAELEAWRPSTVTADEPGFGDIEVCQLAESYLEAWRRRNFGAMAGHLPLKVGGGSVNKVAGIVRETFSEHDRLVSYRLIRASFDAAAVCEIDVELSFPSETRPGRMRWIREREDGQPALPSSDGRWSLYLWGPEAILNRASADD